MDFSSRSFIPSSAPTRPERRKAHEHASGAKRARPTMSYQGGSKDDETHSFRGSVPWLFRAPTNGFRASGAPKGKRLGHWEAIDPRNVSRRLRAIGTPRVSHPWDWSICSPVVGRLASLGKLSLFQLLQNISCAVRLEKHSQILKLNWSFIDFSSSRGSNWGGLPIFILPLCFFAC